MIIQDEQGNYTIEAAAPDAILALATEILESRINNNDVFCSPAETRKFLQLKLGTLEHEVFACLFLDNRHRLISFDILFRGTIDGAAIPPREVAKDALRHNASAVIFAHNHPSGAAEPSQADKQLTDRLKSALDLLGIRVLDHLVIGNPEVVSFAERGLI